MYNQTINNIFHSYLKIQSHHPFTLLPYLLTYFFSKKKITKKDKQKRKKKKQRKMVQPSTDLASRRRLVKTITRKRFTSLIKIKVNVPYGRTSDARSTK